MIEQILAILILIIIILMITTICAILSVQGKKKNVVPKFIPSIKSEDIDDDELIERQINSFRRKLKR